MKKVNIALSFDEDKLSALEFSLKKEGTSTQVRLEETLAQLYEQTLDSRAAPPARPRRPSRPAPKERAVPPEREGGA